MGTKLQDMLDKYREQLLIMRDIWARYKNMTVEQWFELTEKANKQMALVAMWNHAISLHIESLAEPAKKQAYDQLTVFLDGEDDKDDTAGVKYPR
jgi:endo-1,4-beta-mannosidase